MKKRMLISFSGGRTSGYMTKMLLEKYSEEYDFKVVFANTGFENEATLDFVHNCDVVFGFNTVWIEAVVRHGERKSNTFKIVNYETASRNGEPFEESVKKYGIPNQQFPQCTRDLKLYPIENYIRSIGWEAGSYSTAIGIRTDETRRVRDPGVRNIVYPLVHWFPADKQDVLDWWEGQVFDLQLLEHQGNCRTCWKKSFKKLVMLYNEDNSQFEFFDRLERSYGTIGPEFSKYEDALPRVFFRGRKNVGAIAQMAFDANIGGKVDMYADGGCSESCELFVLE